MKKHSENHCSQCHEKKRNHEDHCSECYERKHFKKCCKHKDQKVLCGQWSSLQSCNVARELFACTSGPDQSGGSPTDVDSDPRVYIIGGNDEQHLPLKSCEKYDPNTDTWTFITDLPEPLGNCSATFVPDYGQTKTQVLGYIYVIGGLKPTLFRYNIKEDKWETFPIPFSVINASIQYSDDFGGPLAELLQAMLDVSFPACSDTQTLWVLGGDGTETDTWYVDLDTSGNIIGEWVKGPEIPLKRRYPLIGRTFWRDTGITTFGVSNCASTLVCGGYDDIDNITNDVQILVRYNCNWIWITFNDNPTNFPNEALKLAFPVADGSFGTEQWPETLVTGGRPILFGGNPSIDNAGSVQYSQLRFVRGRYQTCDKDYWNITTSMPGQRTNFEAAPLSQVNSSAFGGRRVSRFVIVGGRADDGKILNRVQLFELPTP